MTKLRIGLIVSALLGLADISTLLAGGEFPPFEVAVAASILGVITLVAVFCGWRASRAAVGTVIATRALSALSAVPAFFAGDVPTIALIAAAAVVALTVAVVILLVPSLRRQPA